MCNSQYGANPDLQGEYGYQFVPGGCTPLIISTINSSKEITNILLKNGADPNIPCTYGSFYMYKSISANSTPLMIAAYNNQQEIADALLKHGADPNIKTTEHYGGIPPGSTPLIAAGYYGHKEIAESLLKHGADPEISNDEGYTAYKYAREFKFHDVAELVSPMN